MQAILTLIILTVSYTAAVKNVKNYTMTSGEKIIGDCLMMPHFQGKPQPLCRSEKYGNWFDSSLTMMEYNRWLQLQCSSRVQTYKFLEEFTFPYFERPTTVAVARFNYCLLPRTSYAEVLKKINVDLDHLPELTLRDLPLEPALKASNFAGLILKALDLEYDIKLARPRLPEEVLRYAASLSEFRLRGAELPTLPEDNMLQSLTLETGTSIGALGNCSHLQHLTMTSWDVQRGDADEDAGWVSTCLRLQDLVLVSANVDTVYRVLRNASSLVTLEVVNLSNRMFELDVGITNATGLRTLKISQSELFQFHINNIKMEALKHLDLSHNNFDRRTIESLHLSLQQTPCLENLTLSENTDFDMCSVELLTDMRPWALQLSGLKRLVASNAASTGLCLSNLDSPSLQLLDLSKNKVRKLEFDGLPIISQSQLVLKLEENIIEEVKFTEDDYTKYLQDNSLRKPREISIRQLHLRGNRIQNFTAKSIPDQLKFIDLSDNVISYIDDMTARALFSSPDRRLKLAGNALMCDCQNQPFLVALAEHKDQVEDYETLTCATDGQPLSNVSISTLCPKQKHPESIFLRVLLPILLILTALIALVIALYFKYSQNIKVFLYARGLCMCWLREDDLDADRPFDVFVSFSHEDEKYVMEELVPGLEREGYRTCVHARDWVAGEWIPKQIAASIALSRRTLLVLSDGFFKSTWGMLEFRMAHGAALREGRARLVAVARTTPPSLPPSTPAHPDLAAFLATNTYLREDDPRFWDKLKFALPRRDLTTQKPPHTKNQSTPASQRTQEMQDFGPCPGLRSLVAIEDRMVQSDLRL